MKISKGRTDEGRLYRLQSAFGQITTILESCACEQCDSVVLTFIDDGGDILEMSLASDDFDEFAQAVMDFDMARHLHGPREG